MPIEELLALYRCADRSDDDGNDDDTEQRPRSSSSCSQNDLDDSRNLDKDDMDEDEDESELRTLYPETFADDQRHLRSEYYSQSEYFVRCYSRHHQIRFMHQLCHDH